MALNTSKWRSIDTPLIVCYDAGAMTATRVFASIAPRRPVLWAGGRVEIAPLSQWELRVTRFTAADGEPAWSKTFEVVEADPDVLLGAWSAIVVADRYLLLRTQAQRRADGAPHSHKLHHIYHDGRRLWSLPYQTASQVGLYDDRLLVIRFLCTAHLPIAQPPLVAHLIEPFLGQALASHAIPAPAHLLPAYEQAQGHNLLVRLEHDEQRFVARVALASADAHSPAQPGSEFRHPLSFAQVTRWSFGFVCPECLMPGALQITRSIQLPSDSRSDDIALQVLVCQGCGFRGLAVYEESRRGALDSEAWEHTGYRAAAATVARLTTWIGQCPNPNDPDCACAVHALLGTTSGGRWQGLRIMEPSSAFPMRLVRS